MSDNDPVTVVPPPTYQDQDRVSSPNNYPLLLSNNYTLSQPDSPSQTRHKSPNRTQTSSDFNYNQTCCNITPNNCNNSSNNNDGKCLETINRREKRSRIHRIQNHCREFCESTSLRGVPRIVKARDSRQKCLWSTFVLLSFLLCVVCIVQLIIQYRQYDVIHQPKTAYNKPRVFPSLTVCNLRPISKYTANVLDTANIMSAKRYLSALKRAMGKVKDLVTRNEQKLLTMSWNLNSYILNLPNVAKTEEIGHDLDEMIVQCILNYKDGIHVSGILCSRAGRWISTMNSNFINCHTFIADPKYSNRTFGMEIVLYLDTPDDINCNDCQWRVLSSQLTGVRLSLHSSGTYPVVYEKGLNLLPGTLTEIKFIPREWTMMEPPHGKCSRSISKKISFNNVGFGYSEEACIKRKLQQMLAEKCDCIEYNQVPNDLMPYIDKKKICQYLPLSPYKNATRKYFKLPEIKEYLRRTDCLSKVSSMINLTSSNCYSPCLYHTYDTTISAAEWPTKAFHTSFLKALNRKIKDNRRGKPNATMAAKASWIRIKKESEKYTKEHDKVMQTKAADREAKIRSFNSKEFVKKNFLAIHVGRHNFDIIQVAEKPVVSLTNLISQVGGLFSLCCGITLICLAEILEFFILVFDDIMHRQQNK